VAKPLPGFTTETLLTRRSFFEANGLFNTELRHGDSTEWYLRAAERGAVIELLPDVLAFRRLHQTNRSRLLAGNSRDEFLKIVKAVIDRRRVSSDGPNR
jgi:hypothetical protein